MKKEDNLLSQSGGQSSLAEWRTIFSRRVEDNLLSQSGGVYKLIVVNYSLLTSIY